MTTAVTPTAAGTAALTSTTIAPQPAAALRRAIDGACERIAPTWPLDRFIAVNPYWGWRRQPIADAAAALGALVGTALTMPHAWFREEWAAGRLSAEHLDAVAEAIGEPDLADGARQLLSSGRQADDTMVTRLPLLTDLVDASTLPAPSPGRTWTELVTHQIGQHCAAQFDHWQVTWPPDRGWSLFDAWRRAPSVTHGFRWRHGSAWARERLGSLPDSPVDAIATAVSDLGIAEPDREAYLTALLASVNGWAAWCAYRRWQARLEGSDDDAIVELAAIRVAWEWLLAADVLDTAEMADRAASWADAWASVAAVIDANREAQRVDWLLQAAVERTYQDRIIAGLGAASPDASVPEVQAVFCIDVRSEVFRRGLEAAAPSLQTRGFAGFFGLPISYRPAGSTLTRPQLPGLLAPVLEVTDSGPAHQPEALAKRRAKRAGERQRWEAFRRQPSSLFSFVETLGLPYAVKLVKDSLPHRHRPPSWELEELGPLAEGLRPRLALADIDPSAAASLAHRVLVGMGLLDGFAPLVLLCGHGSLSVNNPHAAGLDCGACGGQSGEVNARVLAALLNDPAIRSRLRALGVDIPASTWFVAALHTTTTDEVTMFDVDEVPPSHRPRVRELQGWLQVAGDRVRAERAESLGLRHLASAPRRLRRTLQERANDWAQVRPEWGLAGNAAFVVAPRWRTRHLDLHGRSFLHDYDWRADPEGTVLTSILTAPMVVTNWINLQYHSSTVDNRRYGSGNKVLHNVVGGRIGVFEGNGGDLRIGLPLQSLHDGHTLRHPPLRLSVFVESPSAPIDAIIEQQQVVADLVLNGWLNLLRIEPSDGSVEERFANGWQARNVAAAYR